MRGRVVAPDDADPHTVMTHLMPRMSAKPGWMGFGGGGRMFPGDGAFDFGGVLPGSYDLRASCQAANRSLSALLPLEVTDHNVEGLVVTFKTEPGITIEGVLHAVAPGPANFNPRGIQVSLQNLDQGEQGVRAAPRRDGSFTLENVIPGKYELSIYPPPKDGYLKPVKYAGQESAEHLIEVPAGIRGAKLELAIAFDGGEASGAVEDAAGRPCLAQSYSCIPKRRQNTRASRWRTPINTAITT